MTTHANEARLACAYGDYYSTKLLNELEDTTSLWYELKIAEMSGYDYVFAASNRCEGLCSLAALESFIKNLQAIIGNQAGRTILIGFGQDENAELHFERYHLQWADGFAISWHKESLDNSPQREFVELLFSHSEKLLATSPSVCAAPPA